ncbi:YidH family protein [Sinimarinibacterium sp. NLF-5-8]|uniref:YidH family protein n=1 Tax=Sinimarinibacterium sp. NLF-5-8 TaxID=2698684 RepID=UPI00137BAA99|nr:DUF202 domain-containing protein [Sinimarinibacterium sp. NLF-5-8]QHS09266.1 DUF202 domain-containing protein [Sinimarinibacterium sp. NLF-5-8]
MSNLDDPRVLFAAERTLLAWQRTALTLMGFGFVIERFGLFLRFLKLNDVSTPPPVAHLLGIVFILAGAILAVLATIQHLRVLESLRPEEIPPGYWRALAPITSMTTALLGLGLVGYVIM